VAAADEVFEAFAAAIPTSPPDVAAVRPQIEAAFEEAVRAGAQRWPEVAVDRRALAAAMARSLVGGWETLAVLSELHAADLYLAQACASGDPRAIAAFERTYTTTIASALCDSPMTSVPTSLKTCARSCSWERPARSRRTRGARH
jgi:hypothetical protein